MIDVSESMVGKVNVFTTDHRGHNPEELAQLALDKILYVGDNSHPLIAQQARAFKENIRSVLERYLAEAQKSERLTICGLLTKHGHDDMAEIIRRF